MDLTTMQTSEVVALQRRYAKDYADAKSMRERFARMEEDALQAFVCCFDELNRRGEADKQAQAVTEQVGRF